MLVLLLESEPAVISVLCCTVLLLRRRHAISIRFRPYLLLASSANINRTASVILVLIAVADALRYRHAAPMYLNQKEGKPVQKLLRTTTLVITDYTRVSEKPKQIIISFPAPVQEAVG